MMPLLVLVLVLLLTMTTTTGNLAIGNWLTNSTYCVILSLKVKLPEC